MLFYLLHDAKNASFLTINEITIQESKGFKMNVTQAIEETARHFASKGNFNPSFTDTRCAINDLIDYNKYYKKGYNQELAHKKVLNILKAQLH